MIPAARLLITFLLKLIIIACSLKDLQDFFIQYLLLYTSGLFSMILNDDIVDILKPDGICFDLYEFPILF